MGNAETREVIERYFGGSADASIFAEDVEFHMLAEPEPYVGRQAILERFAQLYRVGFSPARADVRNIYVDGDTGIVEFTFRGTSTGRVADGPPAGTMVEVPICGVYEVEGGAIKRARTYHDGRAFKGPGWPS